MLLHDGGMAMSEYARHAVTFRKGVLRVNFLTPGRFAVPLPGGKWASVKIATAYPARAEATIDVDNVPADIAVKLRVPACVRKAEVKQTRAGQKVQVTLHGKLGHRIEQCHPGVMLTYGPLVLGAGHLGRGPVRPAGRRRRRRAGRLHSPGDARRAFRRSSWTRRPDADGFVQLPHLSPAASAAGVELFRRRSRRPTWVEGSAVEVPLKFPSGKMRRCVLRRCATTRRISVVV